VILLRSLIYVLFLYGSMLVVSLLYFPAALFDRKAALGAPRDWARWNIKALEFIVGAKVTLEGTEHIPPSPALYASKHQAMLDTMTPFMTMLEPSIILKKELLKMPVFGWYAVRTGMISIDREAQARALKGMLREARARRDEGRDIVIFPEGTRQEIGAAPEYKPGVAALYRDLGLPCVPIAVSTGLVWSAHGPIRRPGRATIKFLEPIPPGLNRDDFMRELETRIERETAALVERDRTKA
jgi:1-acyl-sn-glycerol-3-phosphate acyltransferase